MAEVKKITLKMIQSDNFKKVKTIKLIKPRKSLKKKRNRREFNVFKDNRSSAL